MLSLIPDSYSDVLAIARTFGNAALDHVLANTTIGDRSNVMIRNCRQWAKHKTVQIENVNDGNIEYSVDAVFISQKLIGDDYITMLDDIMIIRTGFGAYSMSAADAVNGKHINTLQLHYVLTEIKARNEAESVLSK